MVHLPKRAFRESRAVHGIFVSLGYALLLPGKERNSVFCLSPPWKAAKGQWDECGSAGFLQLQGQNWAWESWVVLHKSRQEQLPEKS